MNTALADIITETKGKSLLATNISQAIFFCKITYLQQGIGYPLH